MLAFIWSYLHKTDYKYIITYIYTHTYLENCFMLDKVILYTICVLLHNLELFGHL